MREIKFRAWLSGKHGSTTFTKPMMDYDVSIGSKGGWLDIEGGWDIHGELTDVPIMQFIGLKDKNGKEIYEGDIVRWTKWNLGSGIATEDSYINSEIIFSEGAWVAKGHEIWNFSIYDDIEIIGNIYENPGLINLI